MDRQNIKKIYDLLYSPIVTPYNLLENAKLDNYNYVNYYKGSDGLICEMKCTLTDGKDAIFYYHFDSEDKLMKVYQTINDENYLVFEREAELLEKVNECLNSRKISASAV